jgi:hypothetical protein
MVNRVADMVNRVADMVNRVADMVNRVAGKLVLVVHDNELLVDNVDAGSRADIRIDKDIDWSKLDVDDIAVDSLEVHRVSKVYHIVDIAICLILVPRFYFHCISNIF